MQEDTCELCYEYDLGCNDRCKYCALGNPCIDCEDYDRVNDTCTSEGACGDLNKHTDSTWKRINDN